MAFLKVGGGSLSVNKYKKHDAQAQYSGKITINDVQYELGAWVKENEYGKYFSIAVSQKVDAPVRDVQTESAPPLDGNDQIPF